MTEPAHTTQANGGTALDPGMATHRIRQKINELSRDLADTKHSALRPREDAFAMLALALDQAQANLADTLLDQASLGRIFMRGDLHDFRRHVTNHLPQQLQRPEFIALVVLLLSDRLEKTVQSSYAEVRPNAAGNLILSDGERQAKITELEAKLHDLEVDLAKAAKTDREALSRDDAARLDIAALLAVPAVTPCPDEAPPRPRRRA